MNELLMEGTTALIAGMGTVFAILILISLVISAFAYIDPASREKLKATKQAKNEGNTVVGVSSGTKAQGVSQSQKVAQEEQARIVAAISVALATALNTTVDRLHVKAVRRI